MTQPLEPTEPWGKFELTPEQQEILAKTDFLIKPEIRNAQAMAKLVAKVLKRMTYVKPNNKSTNNT